MSLKNLKELNRKTVSVQSTPGFLGQSAQYKLEKFIQTYSTDLTKSYTVVQTNASKKSSELYCCISKHPEIIDFSRFASFVSFTFNKNILPIVDYGVTVIEDSEAFGMVLPFLSEDSLIENNLILCSDKPEVVLQKIIIPILELLVQLHSLNLTHGSINHNNVWIEAIGDEIENVFVSNTALEIPGYSQIPNYEPLNRMLVHKAAKEVSKQADCYAVGILLASLLSGKLMSKKGYENIVSSKAKIGSYGTIVDQLFDGDESRLGKSSRYALYWLLHDDENKRWTAQQALRFLRKRHRNITLNNISKLTQDEENLHKSLLTPLHFSGEECYSVNEAAVSAIKHYDEIKLKVKNGKLIKELLDNPDIRPDFIKKVSDLRLLNGFNGDNGITQEEMFLTLFIVLLNNQMPIKLKDVSFQLGALWQFEKYVLHNPFISIANTWSKVVKQQNAIYSNVVNICGVNIEKINLPPIAFISNQASFMSGYMDKNSIYILKNKICFSASDLIDVMNSFSEEEFNEVVLNRSFIGFIIGKLYREKVRIDENSLIDLVKSDFALFFFAIKLYCEVFKYKSKHIAGFIKNKLLNEYVPQIRNIKLKNRVISQLEDASVNGDIPKMYQVISDKEIDKSELKYKKVVDKVRGLKSIVSDYDSMLKDNENLRNISREKTIKIAFSVLIITLLFVFYKLFWI